MRPWSTRPTRCQRWVGLRETSYQSLCSCPFGICWTADAILHRKVGKGLVASSTIGGLAKTRDTMRYKQESYAKDLHDALIQELATLVPEAVVSAEGSGVHWNCDARKGERFCSISCFDVQGEPEYLSPTMEKTTCPISPFIGMSAISSKCKLDIPDNWHWL